MANGYDELVEFTRAIVRTKSISAEEGDVIKLMTKEMERLRYDSIVVDEAGSLIGIVEGDRPGPTILLDGHCDTVDANKADWIHDPWGADIENGRIYGRGTADMKGSLAAMIHAVGKIDRAKIRGRIALSATVSEEVAEGCALEKVMDFVRPDYVVIGEATRLAIDRGGRGRAEIHLKSFGTSAHSSSPQAGHCAVTDMLELVHAIARHPRKTDPVLGPGSMVLTDIISEPYPGHSVIPYRCRTTYDRRLLVGESDASVAEELKALCAIEGARFEASIAVLEEKTCTGHTFVGKKFFPAWILSEDHPLVGAALRGLKSVGIEAALGAYRFCTNAAYSAGRAGIPTIGFGIGREEDAHTVDESIAIEDLYLAERGYQGIVYSVSSL
jgi:putative selenium metabolism hydrolase